MVEGIGNLVPAAIMGPVLPDHIRNVHMVLAIFESIAIKNNTFCHGISGSNGMAAQIRARSLHAVAVTIYAVVLHGQVLDSIVCELAGDNVIRHKIRPVHIVPRMAEIPVMQTSFCLYGFEGKRIVYAQDAVVLDPDISQQRPTRILPLSQYFAQLFSVKPKSFAVKPFFLTQVLIQCYLFDR